MKRQLFYKESKVLKLFSNLLPPITFIAFLISAWQIYCIVKEIPVWKLAKPSDIAIAFITGFKETVPFLATTYLNIISGFLLAILIGMTMAFILSNSQILAMCLTPIIVVLCCVPMVTLVPLLLVTMGIGSGSKILTIVIQCFPIVNMNACVGIANVNKSRIELMQSMKASKLETYRYCILRDAMPDIFTGIKLSSVLAMISGVSAEICGGSGGLGNRMNKLISLNRTPEAFSCLIYVIVLGLILYGVISLISKKMTKGMTS